MRQKFVRRLKLSAGQRFPDYESAAHFEVLVVGGNAVERAALGQNFDDAVRDGLGELVVVRCEQHDSLEIDEAEDVIINHNMTDFTDILVDMVKEQEKEMADAAGKKE